MKKVLSDRKSLIYWLLFILFSLIFAFMVRHLLTYNAKPTLTWMRIYKPDGFIQSNFQEIIEFYKNLRSGIPPFISFLEIVELKLFGRIYNISGRVYRLGLLLAYVAALGVFSRSYFHLIFSFLFSGIFIWATTIIHIGNPQIYDILYPLFILSFFIFLQAAARNKTNKPLTIPFVVLAGFSLSMAELSRPFVLYLLPLLLVFAYYYLRHLPKKYFLFLLVPILLFSGLWHAKLLIFNHGQISWSNHTGFNLSRGWPLDETPPLLPEDDNAPLYQGGWENLNTQTHYLNSQTLTSAVIKDFLTDPIGGLVYIQSQVDILLRPEVNLIHNYPEHPIIEIYKFAFRLALVYFLAQFVFLILKFMRTWNWALLLIPQNIFLITLAINILVFAIGENREDARFALSLLPFLSALPGFIDSEKSSQ